MTNKEIGERIKRERKSRGYSLQHIADKVGVAKSTIQRYEAGVITNIKLPVIESIANVLNVNPAWIAGKEANKYIEQVPKSKKRGYRIPVLGRVAAGIPIEAIEEVIDWEEIPESQSSTGSYFGLKIKGDSMEPKISNGDVVIVRKQDDAESGDIVIVEVNDDEATCKRLRKYKDGIELISNNPSYQPMFFSNEEIQNKPVKIIGKVTELRAKF